MVDIGIPEAQRKKIVEGLSRLLADSYTLSLKTQNFHWNVTGPMFKTLHLMFEEHYVELRTAIDEIAERIRSLGEYSPGSASAFAKLAQVKESQTVPTAEEMIAELVADHETICRTARSIYPAVEAGQDESTADLVTTRLSRHEKTAWMLRSLLSSA